MISYRTNHANHVHQLAVSVSKHYYASKDGLLKYQRKPMEITLEDIAKQQRRHMILYSLRDHFSGLFYSEITFGPAVMEIADFLNRAWLPKAGYDFHGIPEALIVSGTVKLAFPALESNLARIETGLINPTSGFQTGIRDLRTIEENLGFALEKPIQNAQDMVKLIYLSQAKQKGRGGAQSRLEMWRVSAPPIRIPPKDWGHHVQTPLR
jgi:hypothetical protein